MRGTRCYCHKFCIAFLCYLASLSSMLSLLYDKTSENPNVLAKKVKHPVGDRPRYFSNRSQEEIVTSRDTLIFVLQCLGFTINVKNRSWFQLKFRISRNCSRFGTNVISAKKEKLCAHSFPSVS